MQDRLVGYERQCGENFQDGKVDAAYGTCLLKRSFLRSEVKANNSF
jgi:hypothetical protein